jgi:hypothetical protein
VKVLWTDVRSNIFRGSQMSIYCEPTHFATPTIKLTFFELAPIILLSTNFLKFLSSPTFIRLLGSKSKLLKV